MKHREQIVAMLDASGCKMPELGHWLIVRDDVGLARDAIAAITSDAGEWTAPDGYNFRRPLPPLEDHERCQEIVRIVERIDEKLRAAGRPPLPAALGAFLRIRGFSCKRAIEAVESVVAHGSWTSPDGHRFVAH